MHPFVDSAPRAVEATTAASSDRVHQSAYNWRLESVLMAWQRRMIFPVQCLLPSGGEEGFGSADPYLAERSTPHTFLGLLAPATHLETAL